VIAVVCAVFSAFLLPFGIIFKKSLRFIFKDGLKDYFDIFTF
jgi:hypothetical protein